MLYPINYKLRCLKNLATNIMNKARKAGTMAEWRAFAKT